jgi:outer membrane lipoprotein SlyB|tara:strand:+ start:394 stop:864 length:471 start_codon:yes stop_codon:yes gene_type:complete
VKKISAVAATAIALASPVYANGKVTDVRIFDHTKTMRVDTPTTQRVCEDMNVPIYGTTTRQGNASGGALIGMLLGAASGKAVTGDDKGAAIGAIMGGLVGADKGAQPKQSQTIVGYEKKLVCNDVTSVSSQLVDVYSHSTIRFYVDGVRYVLKFQK